MRKVFVLSVMAGMLGGCALPPKPPSPYEAYLKRETTVVPLRPYVASTKVPIYSDSSKLLDFADKLGGGQGKYETDAAYQQRVSALNLFSVIATIPEHNIEFDKQTGAIKFSMMLLPSDCPGAKNYSYMAPVCYGLWLPEVRKVMDHYEGQNGYGAKAGVDVIKVKRPMLVLPRSNRLLWCLSPASTVLCTSLRSNWPKRETTYDSLSTSNRSPSIYG